MVTAWNSYGRNLEGRGTGEKMDYFAVIKAWCRLKTGLKGPELGASCLGAGVTSQLSS